MTRIALSGNTKLTSMLTARGLPRDILRSRPFDLEQHTLTITSEVEGLKPKRVKKQKQIDAFLDLCEDPFGKPYLTVIASFPNDMKAKQAAAYLMERALKAQLDRTSGIRHHHLPLWHTINGSFQDKLRDKGEANPSMLILSTITKDSTNVKLEKIRDLAEQYSSTPRVIVLAGNDPMTFANSRLYLALNSCLYLAHGKKVEL